MRPVYGVSKKYSGDAPARINETYCLKLLEV